MSLDLPPEPAAIERIVELPRSFARDVVLAAFAADAYSLGPHWIYDTDEIDELYPNGVTTLDLPRSEYHPGKGKGDLTHYGDQMLVLLESLAENGEADVSDWMHDWLAFWQDDPESYLDGATRNVLEAWRTEGRFLPSRSHDLAGASRMAPLLSLMAEDPVEEVVAAVREHTASTHGDPLVVDAAEFFARASYHLRDGSPLPEALSRAADETSEAMRELYEMGNADPALPSREMAFRFGQNCDVSNALPLTVWLALKFEDDPVRMLEENVLVGGDSSARGMLLAILVAARGDFAELPVSWTAEQVEKDRVLDALQVLVGNDSGSI
ncbi:ADP-ribosylglycohydrolase family protein [Pelagicoccus sp. NFK12]|uniref:ADP-ribosylglycohydrolase family protein n=1 Tax=Pelagicoccus enzymogenes TaxID=2773457 RepID=A0A927F5M4_9BACT|nr:ADP-ribosylglycohydrolase family protein [Pelagicoccus enzymogenes]MBD5778838.1 ADP-ribosylglycohydrolase family protein [Pelagicoccus enzymogenes]